MMQNNFLEKFNRHQRRILHTKQNHYKTAAGVKGKSLVAKHSKSPVFFHSPVKMYDHYYNGL